MDRPNKGNSADFSGILIGGIPRRPTPETLAKILRNRATERPSSCILTHAAPIEFPYANEGGA